MKAASLTLMREVLIPEGMALGRVAPAILDALEPGASAHCLLWHMEKDEDGRSVLMGLTHQRLGVCIRYVDKPDIPAIKNAPLS